MRSNSCVRHRTEPTLKAPYLSYAAKLSARLHSSTSLSIFFARYSRGMRPLLMTHLASRIARAWEPEQSEQTGLHKR